MTSRIDWPVIVFGILGIVFLDATCEFITEFTGDEDEWWTLIPNVLFYASLGFIAGWRRSAATAAYAGVAVFVADITVGWWIETLISHESLELDEVPEAFAIIVVVRLILSVSTLIAYGGGALGEHMRTSRA